MDLVLSERASGILGVCFDVLDDGVGVQEWKGGGRGEKRNSWDPVIPRIGTITSAAQDPLLRLGTISEVGRPKVCSEM